MPTPMRQAIARHMTYSKQHIPHYYLTMRPAVDAALSARKTWNAEHGEDEGISVNDLLVRAVALALAAHPIFNGYYQDEAFHPQSRVNVGIAIALPDGLIAPALLDCQSLALPEIGQHARDLAARARAGTIRAEEYTAATFTVTNLGMYHVDSFSAIIVPPQVGILAVGAINEQAGEHRLALTLSGDHRATDGAEGALFLGEIVACLQNPVKLFG